MSDGNLTFAELLRIRASLPEPLWRVLVVRPEVENALRRDTRFENAQCSGPIRPFMGLEIQTKFDQVAMAWAFKDINVAYKYLNGELKEENLLSLNTEQAKPFTDGN